MHPRHALALAALVLATTLAGCSTASPTPASSGSPPATASAEPTPSPEPLAYDEVPVNCLNVLSPELRERLLGMTDVAVASVTTRQGPYGTSSELGFDAFDRWVTCELTSPDAVLSTGAVSIQMYEFDPSQTASAAAALLAGVVEGDGVEVGTVDGIADSTLVRMTGEDREYVGIVLPGRRFDIGGAPVVEWYVAETPDPTFDAAAFMAALGPVGQDCATMLPQDAGVGTDASGAAWLLTDSYGTGPYPLSCLGQVAGGFTEDALSWSPLDATARDALLADADAGTDGMARQGTTDDDEGELVTSAGAVLVAFDDALVSLTLPVDQSTALTIARGLHAPAWLDVPPLA
ncbi:hypothetical protein [Agrococcus jejuensis]|uniref:DUF3558 domain-containing protein n=1 Tax=Agrococcus jejuensis TaxID=399736 RepID=A0A1G8GJA2_9MICO|nr:hypothetical protein [Agrococcus jejuensis]SDH94479.1 hypothetical protein SAMN04489720_2960 [Agrococcus jejuensis]